MTSDTYGTKAEFGIPRKWKTKSSVDESRESVVSNIGVCWSSKLQQLMSL